jgi:hypothetical protein
MVDWRLMETRIAAFDVRGRDLPALLDVFIPDFYEERARATQAHMRTVLLRLRSAIETANGDVLGADDPARLMFMGDIDDLYDRVPDAFWMDYDLE